MRVVYALYINEPPSRNLDEKVNPHETEWRRLEDLHKIDALIGNMVEDLSDLLPPGYTVVFNKEME